MRTLAVSLALAVASCAANPSPRNLSTLNAFLEKATSKPDNDQLALYQAVEQNSDWIGSTEAGAQQAREFITADGVKVVGVLARFNSDKQLVYTEVKIEQGPNCLLARDWATRIGARVTFGPTDELVAFGSLSRENAMSLLTLRTSDNSPCLGSLAARTKVARL
jgi:hypothetical protein